MFIIKWLSSCVLLLVTVLALGQTEIKVINESQEALPFVEVFTNDFTFSTLSDENGNITIPKRIGNDKIIIFNYLGYEQSSFKKFELIDNPLVVMKHGLVLEEILLVGRTDNQSRDLAGKVESINAKVFQLTNPQTTADALGQHSDVYIQRSQMGGGSPIVRGFEANKVLLVLDGVRMNNAIYRSGHLQNAITIDNSMLERLEVLYGPGSLIYGSDAIGGVVHFRSKNPMLNFDDNQSMNIFGNAYTRYASANSEKSAHVDFNIGSKKFGSLTSLSYSDYGDLRTGSKRGSAYPDFGKRLIYADRINGKDTLINNSDPNVQIGTAYSQLDILQKFLYQPSEIFRMIANFQYSTSSDVPRYDALTEMDGQGLSFSEWYYGPQNRFLSSLRTDINKHTQFFDKIIWIAAFQNIDEDRIDRQFGSNNLDRQEEDVNIFSLTIDLHKFLDDSETFEINYGGEYNKNDLTSIAFRTNIIDGAISSNILTRYPSGGSSTNNLAAYALVKKSLTRIDLFSGLRYSRNSLEVKYNISDNLPWPENYYEGVSTTNSALSWSLGTTYKSENGLNLSGQVSSAFRSPNIDDLAKIRVNIDEISVPNLNLQPETSINAEITISKKIGSSALISATAFMTHLDNAIIRDNFTLPDGSSYLIDEGDTLYTFANVNANAANVSGISINVKSALTNKIEFSGSLNYIKGNQIDGSDVKSPLSHIPPLYGKISLSYVDDHQNFNLKLHYNGNKPLELYGGSEDNLESATPIGTPSWFTLNAYYQRKITSQLSTSIALENILDRHYRPFASGVSAPGRNLIISLNAKF